MEGLPRNRISFEEDTAIVFIFHLFFMISAWTCLRATAPSIFLSSKPAVEVSCQSVNIPCKDYPRFESSSMGYHCQIESVVQLKLSEQMKLGDWKKETFGGHSIKR